MTSVPSPATARPGPVRPRRNRYVDPRRVTVQSPLSLGGAGGDHRVVGAERAPAPGDEVLAGAVEEVPAEVGRLEVQRQGPGPQAPARREPVTGPRHPAVVAGGLQAVAAAGHRVAVLRDGPPLRGRGQRHQPRGRLGPLPGHGGGVHGCLHRGRRVGGVRGLDVAGGAGDGVLGQRVVVVVRVPVEVHGQAAGDGHRRVHVRLRLGDRGLPGPGVGGVLPLEQTGGVAGGLAVGRDQEARADHRAGGEGRRPDQPASQGAPEGAGGEVLLAVLLFGGHVRPPPVVCELKRVPGGSVTRPTPSPAG